MQPFVQSYVIDIRLFFIVIICLQEGSALKSVGLFCLLKFKPKNFIKFKIYTSVKRMY